MVKVQKLKWNMHAAKAQISMRGNHVYKGFESAKSHNSGFLNTIGCLNQTKCFMMMISSFMYLHGIHKPMSTRYPYPYLHYHNSQKMFLSTQYTTEKSHGLHDIKADILKLTYHHPR